MSSEAIRHLHDTWVRSAAGRINVKCPEHSCNNEPVRCKEPHKQRPGDVTPKAFPPQTQQIVDDCRRQTLRRDGLQSVETFLLLQRARFGQFTDLTCFACEHVEEAD